MDIDAKVCRIRSFRRQDAASLAACANNRAVWLQLRDLFPFPYGEADAAAFIDRTTGERPESAFAIAVDGEAVGGIGLVRQSDIHRYTAELGYWLGEAYWGRGIATAAVAATTAWALEGFGVMRVFATPFADNPASCQVLEKAGFLREGLLKASAVKDGRRKDQVMYARIREEEPPADV